MHDNPNKTAKELGHPDARLLNSTYKNINTMDGKTITKKIAEAFWAIRPKQEGQVIQFRKVG